MRRAHTVEQVRAAEAELMARLPEGTLMQRAATGLAVALGNFLGRVYGARVVLLVGSGDNGGDALYAGEKLARRGAQVVAVLLSDKVHTAGLAALRQAGGRIGGTEEIATADVVVDGIVGIGGRPGLKPQALTAVRLAEQYAVPVVAVDIPSGVDVDTGETPDEHVRAALTVTFGTHKICHFVDPAATACGPVHLVDIGLELPAAPVEALQAADVRARYPVPRGESDKYSRGVLGLMAGSAQYPGAAVIATGGALGGPLGMMRYVGPEAVGEAVRTAHAEIVVGEGRVQAWAIGSGLGDELDVARVRDLLDDEEPVLLDADGLKALDDSGDHVNVLITPHAGELARLLQVDRATVEAERLTHARLAADRYDVTVLLKGSTTVIAAPDGRVRVNTNATPWLATAGSGDVLAGLCGSLLAAGLDPFDAAAVGAHLHAAAARLSATGGPTTAIAIARALPAATRQLLDEEN
ncbi:carbohydrate kinase, YjeF related protein [Kribbella flavida DSM 17836]|uniref:Bifunctional NAD(P)H-hydrate repair enzyme n=1 Tax=Kribbella flavida (strain DSM 17836 / JCM 10339 / NBRC 14399) TaxID=479435 RepID=D2PSZ8_KRIFD|nr:bifunctional ADP-dependent NAD(P)H-hydrate dehydratase/NAD(P)H-hydrate epimerase [Kribbella flavida]ADB35050.1 carbohydrate kinase, YjeF related protein [Kribbella flavida DSM 17836]